MEYLYFRRAPVPNTLLAQFLTFVQRNDSARMRLAGTGYLPCITQDGAPVDLCNRC